MINHEKKLQKSDEIFIVLYGDELSSLSVYVFDDGKYFYNSVPEAEKAVLIDLKKSNQFISELGKIVIAKLISGIPSEVWTTNILELFHDE